MSGGYVALNPGDRVRVVPPIDVPTEGETDSLKDHGSHDESDDESEYDQKQSPNDKSEFGKPKKILYIAKPVEKLPYNGEIIRAKRYCTFLSVPIIA
jgi:hypothetical protein